MVVIRRAKTESDMKLVQDIRMEVFADEQEVPVELVLDGLDEEAVQILAFVDEEPAGCARMLKQGSGARIGQVAVRKSMRRYGIGSGLLKLLFSIAYDEGVGKLTVSSRLSAVDFYKTLGFEAEGEAYQEKGAPHILMARNL